MTPIFNHVSPAELMDGTQTRKRPRPVVSCLRCREKKLKCDRTMPCENCTKSGCPSDCMYNHSPASLDALPRAKRVQLGSEAVDQHPDPRVEPGRNAGVGIIEDFQLRLAKLEELLSVKPPTNLDLLRDVSVRGSRYIRDAWYISLPYNTNSTHSSPQSSGITQPASSPPFLGTLVVKGTRTRYHGQNNRITLLNKASRPCRSSSDCYTDMPSSPKQKSSSISAPKILPLSDWPKKCSFSKVNPSCRRVRQSQYQIWKVPRS